MNSIKSIFGGLFAIILMGLLAQLIFLFLSVGYFSLVKMFPSLSFLSELTTILLFAITAMIAFPGGIITAKLARKAVPLHCLTVGSMAGALTLIPSLIDGYVITVNGIIFLTVFLVATVAGGLYWKNRQLPGFESAAAETNTQH
jgi:hypothetical protein